MIAAFLLAATSLQATQPASANPVLSPSSTKWVVDYHEAMCVASRTYASGANAITLGLRPVPLSSRSEVVLLTPRKPNRTGDAELRFLPDGSALKGTYQRSSTANKQFSVARAFFDSEDLKKLGKATAIALSVGGETHRLAIPAAAAAMRALTTCQADLLKSWNVDPGELTDGGSPPVGNVGQFFGRDQYPADAISAGVQGRVVAILNVGTDCRVSACRVVERAHPSLDATTCNVALKKLRYTPGKDRNGVARESHVVLPVHWAIYF